MLIFASCSNIFAKVIKVITKMLQIHKSAERMSKQRRDVDYIYGQRQVNVDR